MRAARATATGAATAGRIDVGPSPPARHGRVRRRPARDPRARRRDRRGAPPRVRRCGEVGQALGQEHEALARQAQPRQQRLVEARTRRAGPGCAASAGSSSPSDSAVSQTASTGPADPRLERGPAVAAGSTSRRTPVRSGTGPRPARSSGHCCTGQAAAQRAAGADARCALLDLPAAEAVGLAGAGADRPLPAEAVGRARAVEQVREEVIVAVAPVRDRGARPSARPSTCASGSRASRRARARRRRGRRHAMRRTSSSHRARSPPRAGTAYRRLLGEAAGARVEVPRVLLPQQLVAELLDVAAPGRRRRGPRPAAAAAARGGCRARAATRRGGSADAPRCGGRRTRRRRTRRARRRRRSGRRGTPGWARRRHGPGGRGACGSSLLRPRTTGSGGESRREPDEHLAAGVRRVDDAAGLHDLEGAVGGQAPRGGAGLLALGVQDLLGVEEGSAAYLPEGVEQSGLEVGVGGGAAAGAARRPSTSARRPTCGPRPCARSSCGRSPRRSWSAGRGARGQHASGARRPHPEGLGVRPRSRVGDRKCS